jgi:hypothetical protein
LFLSVVKAWAVDTYNPANSQLFISKVAIGNTLYTNAIVSIDNVYEVAGGTAIPNAVDTYDPITNQLTIPSVNIGNINYTNVIASVKKVISVDATTSVNFQKPSLIPSGKYAFTWIDYRFDQPNSYNSAGFLINSFEAVKPIIDKIRNVGFNGIVIETQVSIDLNTGLTDLKIIDGYIKVPPRDLWRVVDYAKQNGLQVWLSLDIADSISDLEVSSDSKFGPNFNIKTMFDAVAAFDKAIAISAQQHNVDGIYIGVGNSGIDTKENLPYWQNIVNGIKSVFSGKLTYLAINDTPIWQIVDVISVDIHNIHLSSSPVYDLKSILNLYLNSSNFNALSFFQTLKNKYSKPIILDHYLSQPADKGIGLTTPLYNIQITGSTEIIKFTPDYLFQSLRIQSIFELINIYLSNLVDGIGFNQFQPWAEQKEFYQFPKNSDVQLTWYFSVMYGMNLTRNNQALLTINQYLSKPWGYSSLEN